MAKKSLKQNSQTPTSSGIVHRFFRLVPANANFRFIEKAPVFYAISAIFMLVCVWALFSKGLNYGIDFKGGTEVYLRFNQTMDAEQIRQVLNPLGYGSVSVQRYGNADQFEFLVRVQPEDLQLTSSTQKITQALQPLQSGETPVRIRFSEERIYGVFDDAVETAAIESAINSLNQEELKVQYVTSFGKASNHEYMIQFSGVSTKMIQALKASVGADNMEVLQIEEVGEKVGSELRRQAVGAVLISILFILVYVWFRFEFEFSPGAIVALVHDTLGVLGVFALTQMPFDLATVAAMLRLLGSQSTIRL